MKWTELPTRDQIHGQTLGEAALIDVETIAKRIAIALTTDGEMTGVMTKIEIVAMKGIDERREIVAVTTDVTE